MSTPGLHIHTSHMNLSITGRTGYPYYKIQFHLRSRSFHTIGGYNFPPTRKEMLIYRKKFRYQK